MNSTTLTHAAMALTIALFSSAAFAQYVWLDEKGVKQYSDMPPPASTPKKRILKEPNSTPATEMSSEKPRADNAEASPTAPAKSAAPLTIAEKNAEFQKRRAEQEEKDKKAAEQAKQASDKARNCDLARTYQSSLASGVRIATTDKSGERSYMSDSQRDKEMQDNKRILNDCK